MVKYATLASDQSFRYWWNYEPYPQEQRQVFLQLLATNNGFACALYKYQYLATSAIVLLLFLFTAAYYAMRRISQMMGSYYFCLSIVN